MNRLLIYHAKNIIDKMNITSKTYMGTDLLKNRYYITYSEEGKEKRSVEYYDGEPNPRNLPPLWNSWLGFRRDIAPSFQEIQNEETRQQTIKVKSKIIEEEDRKLRLQENAEREEYVSKRREDWNITPTFNDLLSFKTNKKKQQNNIKVDQIARATKKQQNNILVYPSLYLLYTSYL
ncbi:hypothetical protein DFA_09031 [Cavenderia fasciculata]|uniref:NADH dehydrogenase [ubiquinone] 1 alpha subcomplex subunit 12 n=1 Tax=Cavenderia fasciculata TaxID=261658 RepID=F4Q6I3_CACFS|nr:uncharacterized protein DFA_09031 [Cavenderia fasciculata]EGG16493.1 hypothetical protein DFA_09031 [Cavenderia fasciculata]|eukprot:XP_004354893.1 hypothetical protein DFA_09031 [Cavenderia fasciculata]